MDVMLLKTQIESLKDMAHNCSEEEFQLLQAHVEGLAAYIRCLGRGRAEAKHKFGHPNHKSET